VDRPTTDYEQLLSWSIGRRIDDDVGGREWEGVGVVKRGEERVTK